MLLYDVNFNSKGMINMKHMLFVVSQLSTGGAERVISILANNFANRDYEVHLITYMDVTNSYLLDNKIIYSKLPVIRGNRIRQHCARIKWIRKYIRDNDIDIYITFEHYYGWTCVYNTRVAYITSMRNDPIHDKLSIVERLLRKTNFEYAQAVIFQTSEIKNYFSEKIQQHGFIVKNPLPNNLPLCHSEKQKKIVAVSRLEPQKNLSMLLKAFKTVVCSHPEYILEIYGDGSERKNIEQEIIKYSLEKNVLLKGFCENVTEKISDAYIYVCTSNYEGLSNALLECMAMGLAVISTDSAGGGAREVIQDGVNGFLIPVGDNIQLYKKINWLIENRDNALEMGVNAMMIRNELNESVICDKWEKIINN